MKNIFVIPVEDVQYIAKKKIGRKLSTEELMRVKSGVEFGFECWEEVVDAAIEDLQDIVISKSPGT
jgi:hypothetical protein